MVGGQFEHDVALFLEKQGFRTKVTPKSNDRGIDVIAQKEGHTFAVQAKHYKPENKVGSPAVQKTSGLLSRPDIDGAIVITTSSFTAEAKAVANNRGVELFSIEPQSSGRTPRRERRRSSSVNENFSHDPRVQHHQEQAGISPTEQEDKDSNENVNSPTFCPNCGEQLPETQQELVAHWTDCGLPDERPTQIPVDIWWDIKGAVK